MRVANPQDENAAAINGKSAAPPASIQRPKLSNITNKQQLLPSATPKPKLGSKIDTGRTPLRNISNNLGPNPPAPRHLTPLKDSILKPVKQQRKRQSPNGEKQRSSQTRMRSGPFSISEAAEIQAEIWSEQGIENVHFNGDDMEDLRQKLEDQEMENRVKAVLSFREEIFPPWRPRQSISTIEGLLDDDGKLKLDSYEESSDDDLVELELSGFETPLC